MRISFSVLILVALTGMAIGTNVNVTVSWKGSATFTCPTTGTGQTVAFYKDGSAISYDGSKYIQASSTTLQITTLYRADIVSSYTCNVTDTGTSTVTKNTFSVYAVPYLYQLEHNNLIAIEGGTLSASCYLLVGNQSSESITWSWYLNGQKLSSAADSRFSFQSDDYTSKFTISNGYTTDTGYYTCEAKNSVGSATRSIHLIIKSRLLPIWPFLGVVAEMALVAVIITGSFMIHRKNPPKQYEEDDDDDEETKTKNK